jgi:hypothetical protein
MGEGLNRRTALALFAAGLLGSCSRPSYAVDITVDPRAVVPLTEAVQAFAAAHGYTPVRAAGDARDFYYESRRSHFTCDVVPGRFTAVFGHANGILLRTDDLEALAKDFIVAVRQVEGVVVQWDEPIMRH